MPLVLAQLQPASLPAENLALLVVGVAIVVLLAAIAVRLKARPTPQPAPDPEFSVLQARAAEAAARRDDIMFEQHRRLNELTASKLELELRIMETQLRLMETDLQKRDDANQYHATMMQKSKLEIDSLRLQIAEQRKRLDDYGQYND